MKLLVLDVAKFQLILKQGERYVWSTVPVFFQKPCSEDADAVATS